MLILWAGLCGFFLDLLLGDPAWLLHPVVIMGRRIERLERFLRPRLPKTPRGELLGGTILALLLPLGTLVVSGGLCLLATWIHPIVGFLLQALWSWQTLALKGLTTESEAVRRALENGTLPAARLAVGRIVGRDTANLTVEGVAKATVETVAENYADGVVAPLFYLFLGGAPMALTYKAINTMDSMVGYKNAKYLYFGRCAAKLDDAANYLPARLGAMLWIAAAFLTGHNGKNALAIWRRDRRNHASPNSAQTEAACAGALGIELAGSAYYFGERYEKPTIGDALRPVEAEDIHRANGLLLVAGLFALALLALCRGLLLLGRGGL